MTTSDAPVADRSRFCGEFFQNLSSIYLMNVKDPIEILNADPNPGDLRRSPVWICYILLLVFSVISVGLFLLMVGLLGLLGWWLIVLKHRSLPLFPTALAPVFPTFKTSRTDNLGPERLLSPGPRPLKTWNLAAGFRLKSHWQHPLRAKKNTR